MNRGVGRRGGEVPHRPARGHVPLIAPSVGCSTPSLWFGGTGARPARTLAGMSTDPAPEPSNNPPPPALEAPPPSMFAHIMPPVSPEDVERFKAEHAARMKEARRTWPGRKRSKRRGR